MVVKSLKQRLGNGDHVLGTFVFLSSPDVVEILAIAGFDFVIVDTEHATHDWETLRNMIRAGEVHGLATVVRVPDNDPVWIKHVLEAGAQGVMVPFIQSAADVEQAISATLYPPTGLRGVCPLTRPAGYGVNRLGFEQFAARVNSDTLLIGILEDHVGMDDIEAISAVSPGLDVIYLGRSDLAASLGVVGQRDHPLVEERIQAAVGFLERDDRPADAPIGGMQVHDATELRTWVDRGFRVVSVSSDTTILGEACQKVVANAFEQNQ